MPETEAQNPGAEAPKSTQRAKYYFAYRQNRELTLKLSSTAQIPMDPKVVAFVGRLVFADDQIADDKVVQDASRRERYADELLSYAKTGLELGDIETASAALDWFERKIVDVEGPQVRRKQLIALLVVGLRIAIPCSILGLLMTHLIPPGHASWVLELKLVRAGLMLATGNALGILFFAFVRNLDLKFDQLSNFDPANLDPVLRFTLVWIITVIFAILLQPKILIVALGSQVLNNFMDDPLMAVVIGILSGYSDGTVSKLLAGVLNNPKSQQQRS